MYSQYGVKCNNLAVRDFESDDRDRETGFAEHRLASMLWSLRVLYGFECAGLPGTEVGRRDCRSCREILIFKPATRVLYREKALSQK